jgi:hypothetical protein
MARIKDWTEQHPFDKWPLTEEEKTIRFWTTLWSKVGEEREQEVLSYESHDPFQESSQPW